VELVLYRIRNCLVAIPAADYLEPVLVCARRFEKKYVQMQCKTGAYIQTFTRVVSVLDSGAEGPGFKSQSRRCRVTVLGKLFTPIVPLFTSSKINSSPHKGCEGNCRPVGKKWQPTAGFMTHATCRLTAKNRDQLRNPTLGNRVWATFTF